jgi:AraC-like DNA-binding protein
MGYAEYPPKAPLQDWVKCFWTIDDEPSDAVQEVWPDACVELLFSLGNCYFVNDDGSSKPIPRAAVIGLQTKTFRVRTQGALRLLGARLLPIGLGSWSRGDLESLASQIEPLLRADRFRLAIEVLETWLVHQPRVEDTTVTALRELYARAGNISIAQLAARQGQSQRQLERAFAKRLAISPKSLARIVRFAASWGRLLDKPNLSLADLAAELGYADQAHFSNEFRSFGGRSPGSFSRRVR